MGNSARASVTIGSHPMWWLRVTRQLPRYLICATAIAGLVASARFAIAPPLPTHETSTRGLKDVADRAAEGYAVLFARTYLTWNVNQPQMRLAELERFTGPGMESDAGFTSPPEGEQRVEWAEVVQAREEGSNEHVYTIAAQTDVEGLLYLTVGVLRTARHSLALAGYPAFVGAPSAAPTPAAPRLREVSDGSLVTVVERALRNYMSKSSGELAADLTADARVSLPALALTLEAVQHVSWSAEGSSVTAVVQAKDERGGRYTLAYELDVVRAQGRWEVSAVQADPNQ
ncbi:MAG: conjugal transfer protein [Solirubrobacteraceae bacterium]